MEYLFSKLRSRKTVFFSLIALATVLIAGGVVAFTVGGPTDFVSLLASLVTPTRERIFFTTELSPVTPRTIVRLLWDQEGISQETGTYRFSYPCTAEGVTFTLRDGTPIPCNDGAEIGAISPLDVIPSTRSTTTPVTLFVSISFIPDGTGDTSVTGSVSLTVEPERPLAAIPSSTPTPTPTPQNPPRTPSSGGVAPRAGGETVSTYQFPTGSSTETTIALPPGPIPTGTPDLALRVIAVGTVNATGTAFTARTTIPKGERAAIVFDVTNQGKGRSAPWNFFVHLPTLEPYLFRSVTQNALLPGERVRFTIGFSDIREGTTSAVLTIDPDNVLNDADRSNDHATAMFYREP